MIKIVLIPIGFILDINIRNSYNEMKKMYGEPLVENVEGNLYYIPFRYYLFSEEEEEAFYFKLKYNNLISKIIELDD